jgi:uncharacterized protein YjgD (DUF1641 family)
MEEKKSTTRTQDEWYAAALQASDTLFAKQRELFGGMTDTNYYFVEVTRFDTFMKINAGVFAKTYYENTAAKKMDEYLNSVSETLYMSEYTDDDELDKFVPATIKKMENYAAAAKKIIENS